MILNIGRSDGVILWNFILSGLNSNSERISSKRFQLILNVLNELYKRSVPQKQCFDIVTRLFIELPKLSSGELAVLCQHCIDCLRIQAPKCLG